MQCKGNKSSISSAAFSINPRLYPSRVWMDEAQIEFPARYYAPALSIVWYIAPAHIRETSSIFNYVVGVRDVSVLHVRLTWYWQRISLSRWFLCLLCDSQLNQHGPTAKELPESHLKGGMPYWLGHYHTGLSLSLSYRAFIYVWVASLLERDRDQSYRIPGRGVGDPLHAISRLESSHHPDSRWARYFYTGGSSKKWERIIRRSIASRD